MDKRYFTSYYKRLEPQDLFATALVDPQYSLHTAVTDVPMTEFIVHMQGRHIKVVPVLYQQITLTEAAELVNGGGNVKAYYIGGDV
jgi:hypothetical protein